MMKTLEAAGFQATQLPGYGGRAGFIARKPK